MGIRDLYESNDSTIFLVMDPLAILVDARIVAPSIR
jgi:hypothetical protein